MIGFLVFAIWVGAALLPFIVLERRWRWRWQEVELGQMPAHAGDSLYRQSGNVPFYLRRAPDGILVAAFTCLLLGELILPGMVLATLGMFFFGLGMVLVPILISAGKLYRAGLLLLLREPRTAYFAARNAAKWSLWCLGFGVLGSILVCGYAFDWLFVVIAAPAAAVIAGQALYLLHVTRRWEDALFATSRLVRLGEHWVSTDAA
jgi:hypothetical protein